jgi:acyl dehydratase
MRTFEDFHPGDEHELGRVTVTGEEIVDYARRWDPMPFHTDEETARHGPFAGLVASGGHTTAHATRLYVQGLLADSTCQGSYGLDEVRYLHPVRPDDELSVRAAVERAEHHPRRSGSGVVHLRISAANQHGQDVLLLRTRVLVGRRAEG